MKLVVVVGDREYLTPKPVPRETLLGILRRIAPDACVADFAWASGSSDAVYHSLLSNGRLDAVDLALEYVRDTTPATSTAFVVLPFESVSQGSESVVTEPRILRFLRTARGALGIASIRCVSLYVSKNTVAVLTRLRGERGGAPRGREAESDGTEYVVSERFNLEDLVAPGGSHLLDDFRFNYTHAVLEIGEGLVAGTSVLGGPGRSAVVTESLALNHLLLRTDLSPERIQKALEPGGELFELLSKPLPLAVPATAEVEEPPDQPDRSVT